MSSCADLLRLECPLWLVDRHPAGVGSLEPDSPGLASPPPLAEVARLASAQWGVVSRGQLLALGISRGAVEHWLSVGRLQLLYRGVYGVGHRSLRTEGRRLAAVLACGPGAVLSHKSAASHWDLLRTDQTRIDVTAPRGRHGAPGIRLHRTRSLDAQDTTSHQGIPIGPPRSPAGPRRRQACWLGVPVRHSGSTMRDRGPSGARSPQSTIVPGSSPTAEDDRPWPRRPWAASPR